MRRAELLLKALTLTVLAASSAGAYALLPAPGAPSLPTVATAGQEAPKQITAAAVQAVAIGKAEPNVSPAKKAGTLRELEELQAQTALAEARKKLKDLGASAGGPSSEGAAGAPPVGADAAKPAANRLPRRVAYRDLSPLMATPIPGVIGRMDRPGAKLVSLLVVGGRARADVVLDGKVRTVKEGDTLGAWTVSRIDSEGVFVEQRVGSATRGAAATAAAMPGAMDLLASQTGARDSQEIRAIKLDSASAADLQPVVFAPAPAGASGAAAPVVPPLPLAVRQPDSTNIPGATPLPPMPPLLQPIR